MVDEETLVAMVRAGCEFIQIGVEHGSERMLKALRKGVDLEQAAEATSLARKVGMNVGIYLITGIPGETMEDVAMSESLIEKLLPHDVQIAPLAVYPGTRLHSELVSTGELPKDFYKKTKDAEVFARRSEKPIIEADKDSSGDNSRVKIYRCSNQVFTGASWGYVDAHTAQALSRLEKKANAVNEQARYSMEEFRQQKKFLGWCATTNIICGEAAEDTGHVVEAHSQYSEIIHKEPQNPWGWMKRGYLSIELGNQKAAVQDLQEALKIVPKSPEANAAYEYATRMKGRK
jgi:tetratricopeptide (TPR) repeat protein